MGIQSVLLSAKVHRLIGTWQLWKHKKKGKTYTVAESGDLILNICTESRALAARLSHKSYGLWLDEQNLDMTTGRRSKV
jgi:hypothetical protein